MLWERLPPAPQPGSDPLMRMMGSVGESRRTRAKRLHPLKRGMIRSVMSRSGGEAVTILSAVRPSGAVSTA